MINNQYNNRKTLLENMIPIKEISEIAKREGNSKKPVYRIHKWWARRLGAVVRALLIAANLPYDSSESEFWSKFYNKNEYDITVLDPFMGGGTSLIEAKKLGAKIIGNDIDTMAYFLTKKELQDVCIDKIENKFDELYKRIGEKIQSFYVTKIGERDYPVINIFWVYELSCPKCKKKIYTHPHYRLAYNKNKNYQVVFCKKCGEVEVIEYNIKEYVCKKCNESTFINNKDYSRGICTCSNCNEKFKVIENEKMPVIFALEYLNGKERIFKKADRYDIELYDKIEKEYYETINKYHNIATLIPQSKIIKFDRTDQRPISHGYYYYKDLFNKRQLLSLALLKEEILKIEDEELKEWFLIGFSDLLASNNMLCSYAYGYRKLTPLFGIHAYTVPVRPVENNVWGTDIGRGTFIKSIKKIVKAKKYCDEVYEFKYNKNSSRRIFTGEKIKARITSNPEDFYKSNKFDTLLLNKDSQNLNGIKDKSIDIIMTDPPYFDNLHYSELANFYFQWIKNHIHINEDKSIDGSLYVYNNEEESARNFQIGLTNVFKQSYKKLKDSGLMVFSYHHNKPEAWITLGRAIKESQFFITNIIPVRSEGNSAYHSGENAIKWDSIIMMRKTESIKEDIELNIDSEIDYWDRYIKDNDIDMKKCDKLSFYRSLAIKKYCNTKHNIEIKKFFGRISDFLENDNI